MDSGFWKNLPKPFFALAPMADVTDCVFRQIIAKYSRHSEEGGGPDVFWTEFVAADGLVSAGREVLKRDLVFGKNEHPIVAQLFGGTPEKMFKAAELVRELGFDGIDINMGCPDRTIEKQGAGAAMIKTPSLAKEIIKAAREGSGLPISVKTRLGYNKNQMEEWLPALLSEKLSALTVHLRTRKEMSLVPAKWDLMPEIVKMAHGTGALVIGNGDVKNLAEARLLSEKTGCDGIMLGRAIFGNPWLFDENKKEVTIKEKLNVLSEQSLLFEKELGDIKSFAVMKKHFKAYVDGFPGAKELRLRLMEKNSAEDVAEEVKTFLAKQTN